MPYPIGPLSVCPVCPALSSCRVCKFGVLWPPNGWMNQDETGYGGRPRPRSHCATWGPSSPENRGTAPLPNPFQNALAVKTLLDLLKELRSYGGFKLTGLVIPKYSAPPSGETTVHQTPQTFWRCKNVLEVLYHRTKFGGGLDFTGRRGGQKR